MIVAVIAEKKCVCVINGESKLTIFGHNTEKQGAKIANHDKIPYFYSKKKTTVKSWPNST
jgi:hypothetical protein